MTWQVDLTLGKFRELTKDLPDDTMILGEFQEALQYNETSIDRILPASVLGHPAAILLSGGQIVNYELDLDARIDAQLGS